MVSPIAGPERLTRRETSAVPHDQVAGIDPALLACINEAEPIQALCHGDDFPTCLSR